MSAGRGVMHSEYNASATEPLELFQIWIEPKEQGIEPRYAQKTFVEDLQASRSVMVAAPEDKTGETLPLAQDAYISIAMVEKDGPFDYMLHKEGNGLYILVIEGAIDIEGEKLERRDAIGLSDTNKIILTATQPSELLLIEVPM
jgi:redox-sensitive bicupin YhaK (pirin superfamily)